MNASIKILGNRISISSNNTATKISEWGADKHQHHEVTIESNNKSISFDFWASQAQPSIESETDLIEAFYCFLSDGMSGEQGFYEFCNEFGYEIYEDAEKEKANKIYYACRTANKKFQKLNLSCDIYDIVNELQEQYEL